MWGDKVKQPSRQEVIYCENCEKPCAFNHHMGRWTDIEEHPMFTGRHCSRSCYHIMLRKLEIEFTANSENRIDILRRLNAYKEMDRYRCKECGSLRYDCWCD
jgi:hypothetical protein